MTTEWKQYNNGRRWRVLDSQEIETEGYGVTRSGGYPTTMELLFQEFGSAILQAAKILKVPVPWLAGMITVEAGRQPSDPKSKTWEQIRGGNWAPLEDSKYGFLNLPNFPYSELPEKNHRRFDTISLRLEPGYVNQYDTPGRVSGGLTQCLYSTMLDMAQRYEARMLMAFKVDGVHITIPVELCLGDLMDPERACLFATMYFVVLAKRYAGGVEGHAFDFVHLVAAYNAGSIRPVDPETNNPFGMETYDPNRTVNALKYYNDCFAPEILPYWEGQEGGCDG